MIQKTFQPHYLDEADRPVLDQILLHFLQVIEFFKNWIFQVN